MVCLCVRIRRPVSFTDLQPFVHLLGVPVTHSRFSFVVSHREFNPPAFTHSWWFSPRGKVWGQIITHELNSWKWQMASFSPTLYTFIIKVKCFDFDRSVNAFIGWFSDVHAYMVALDLQPVKKYIKKSLLNWRWSVQFRVTMQTINFRNGLIKLYDFPSKSKWPMLWQLHYVLQKQGGVLIYPIRNYPLYHSVYDSMQLATMMDPNFAVSSAVASILAELTRDLADSLIIPLQPLDYAMDILIHLQGPMKKATEKFNASVCEWGECNAISSSDCYNVSVNHPVSEWCDSLCRLTL